MKRGVSEANLIKGENAFACLHDSCSEFGHHHRRRVCVGITKTREKIH